MKRVRQSEACFEKRWQLCTGVSRVRRNLRKSRRAVQTRATRREGSVNEDVEDRGVPGVFTTQRSLTLPDMGAQHGGVGGEGGRRCQPELSDRDVTS